MTNLKSVLRRQVKDACDNFDSTFTGQTEADLHHALRGGHSAVWHLLHSATWVSIVGESYKPKFEPYVYATSLQVQPTYSALEARQQLSISKNRALQRLGELKEEELIEEILPPFPILKNGSIAPISRIKLWTWLPTFLAMQRGFLMGQLQIDPHNRRIEEFL